jgi:hypothetical protein
MGSEPFQQRIHCGGMQGHPVQQASLSVNVGTHADTSSRSLCAMLRLDKQILLHRSLQKSLPPAQRQSQHAGSQATAVSDLLTPHDKSKINLVSRR